MSVANCALGSEPCRWDQGSRAYQVNWIDVFIEDAGADRSHSICLQCFIEEPARQVGLPDADPSRGE